MEDLEPAPEYPEFDVIIRYTSGDSEPAPFKFKKGSDQDIKKICAGVFIESMKSFHTIESFETLNNELIWSNRNDLDRQYVMDILKARTDKENQSVEGKRLCPKCYGDGQTKKWDGNQKANQVWLCELCDGTGYLPFVHLNPMHPCPQCSGTRTFIPRDFDRLGSAERIECSMCSGTGAITLTVASEGWTEQHKKLAEWNKKVEDTGELIHSASQPPVSPKEDCVKCDGNGVIPNADNTASILCGECYPAKSSVLEERFVSPEPPETGFDAELLACALEELIETGQRITKCLRMGKGEIQPGQALNNADRVIYELADVMVLFDILRGRGFSNVSDETFERWKQQKYKKLNRFLQQGQVDIPRPQTIEGQWLESPDDLAVKLGTVAGEYCKSNGCQGRLIENHEQGSIYCPRCQRGIKNDAY